MHHSPEPWRCEAWKTSDYSDYNEYTAVLASNDVEVIGAINGVYETEAPTTSDEDARRIVACVNFCREFPTEYLEQRLLRYIQSKDDIQPMTMSPFAGWVACSMLPVVKGDDHAPQS